MRVVAAAAADERREERETRMKMSKLEVKLGEREGDGVGGGREETLLEEQRYLRRDEEEVGCG